MAHAFVVHGGPNKWDLMLAMFDKGPDRHHPLTFEVHDENDQGNGQFGAVRRTIVLHLTSIAHEDGSGEGWIIEVYDSINSLYRGYYRTDRRTGRLELKLDPRAIKNMLDAQ